MKKSLPLLFVLSFYGLAANAACPSWPTADRFILNGAEATDKRTGLVWRRCSEGQTWVGRVSDCLDSANTYTHEEALALAKAANSSDSATGWRLPNVMELSSLADKGCQNPAIDATAFPDSPSSYFWTSSPNVDNSSSAWLVDFRSGYIGGGYGRSLSSAGGGHVRLVRASQ